MKRILLCGFRLMAFAWFAVLPANAQTTPIPMDQIGAVAGKQYQGDGLSVIATRDGARLRCSFQRLEGDVTPEGLWLKSTAEGTRGERFRVLATKVSREPSHNNLDSCAATDPFSWIHPTRASVGKVEVIENVARLIRDFVTEEYSVSVDGVRQDFIIKQRPTGEGDLRVELEVSGAKAEALENGARLVLDASGRRLAYNSLRVLDGRGQELNARMEVTDANRLALVVDDAAAVYPVQIDPTFSDADWTSMGGIAGVEGSYGSANSWVYATVLDTSGNLYIGGTFSVAGGTTANNIAKWDGNSWSALGSGISGQVRAIAVLDSNIYAGGEFSTNFGGTANYIARWNGSNWLSVGAGMNGNVYTLATSGNDLYVGGAFTIAGGVTVNRIAKWNGVSWSSLGSGMNNTVWGLAVSGADLYAGGTFTTAGGITANRIAKWDGTTWSPLSSGLSGSVLAVATAGSDVYVGGSFSTAGSVSAYGIAKWNGSSWSSLGSRITSGSVIALAVSGSDVYAAGNFSGSIARWNGSSWFELGSGVGKVNALAISGNIVYAGGEFTTAGGSPASYIAKWNGTGWSSLGSGMCAVSPGSGSSYVRALACLGTNLYAGGSFLATDGGLTGGFAKWNGSGWTMLGLGISNFGFGVVSNGSARAFPMITIGSDVYSCGADGGNYFITKWSGNNWSVQSPYIQGVVNAIAVVGNEIYVGGNFTGVLNTNFSLVPANYIAKWNGISWSTLGSGLNSQVTSLAIIGTNIYAGGLFTTAGGNTASYVAKWNGSNWSAVGSGLNNFVNALAVSGDNLFVGGQFTTAGGNTANSIAMWNGTNWSALGSGLAGSFPYVQSIIVANSNLYVGGGIYNAGGVFINNIAKWNGTNWSALGSGVNNIVYALTVSGSDLYAGGNFGIAGGKVSARVAKANISGLPYPGNIGGTVYSPLTGFRFTFNGGSVGQSYRIQRALDSVGPWTDFTNFVYTAPITITDASAILSTNRFYRAISP